LVFQKCSTALCRALHFTALLKDQTNGTEEETTIESSVSKRSI
jgi:hypothetical protein